MGYSGAGRKLIHEKNKNKKSRDTVPLNCASKSTKNENNLDKKLKSKFCDADDKNRTKFQGHPHYFVHVEGF